MKWIVTAVIIILVAIAALGFRPWMHSMNSMKDFSLTSPAFLNGDYIPSKYTCDELSINPPLEIRGTPSETKSLVLIMDDPDVPKDLRPDGVFDHWVVYEIPPKDAFYDEGQVPGAQGLNGSGAAKYAGPCPPLDHEPTTHRYYFKLYALDTNLNFIKAPTKDEVLMAIGGHIIAEAELMGKYDKNKTIREND